MIWLNMVSTLRPLPLGDDAAGEAKGRREEDMMGEKRGTRREKKEGMMIPIIKLA
jgi:hypothetical protein